MQHGAQRRDAGPAGDEGEPVLVRMVGKDEAPERTVHVDECAGLNAAGAPIGIDPDEQFEQVRPLASSGAAAIEYARRLSPPGVARRPPGRR
jgi:hypothetical protein